MSANIMLIDDEQPILATLGEFLSLLGFEVRHASNTEEALAKYPGADLAICDLSLGDGNGLELIGQLKGRQALLKILVLTGYPTIDALQTATELGVSGFLTKPPSFPELLATVDRCLGQQFGRVMLFPAALKEKLKALVPYLGDVVLADAPEWPQVRTRVREVAAVLLDVTAPEATTFLDECQIELAGRCLFLMCREEDFLTVRQLMNRIPSAKCTSLEMPTLRVLRLIRAHMTAQRETSERVRVELSEYLGRCTYAKPLRTGYYCSIAGPCPFGEEKQALVNVRGKDHYRCPRRAFPIRNTEGVGLLSWRGKPEEETVFEYRAALMDQIQQGRTHLIINCQHLDVVPFSLCEILADAQNALADKPAARIDVINLAPKPLQTFQASGKYLVSVQFHEHVMVEMDGLPDMGNNTWTPRPPRPGQRLPSPS